MRRARIQVKPSLNPRPSKVTSSEKEESKKTESSSKPTEVDATSSGPNCGPATETTSSTSSTTKLNFRRPAFSVRPKPSLRGLGVPNLHGSEPSPIQVSTPSSSPDGTGDACVSDPKTTEGSGSKAPISDGRATPEKERLSEDASKDVITKEKNECIPVKKTQIVSAVESDSKTSESSSSQESKSSLILMTEKKPNNESAFLEKSEALESKSEFISKPNKEKESSKSVSTERIQSAEASSVNLTDSLVSADKGKSIQQKPDDNSSNQAKPIPVRRSRFSVQPKIGVKSCDKKVSTNSVSLSNEPSLVDSKTVENLSKENEKEILVKSLGNSDSNLIKTGPPVSMPRRSKFQVKPKLNLKPTSSRVPSTVESSPLSQATSSKANHQDSKEEPKKEEEIKTPDINQPSTISKPESTIASRCKEFQDQPKIDTKPVKESVSLPNVNNDNLLASASGTVDQSAAASVSEVTTGASTTVDQSAAASVSEVTTGASTTVDQSAAASVSEVTTSASTTVDQSAAVSVSKVSSSASTTVDQPAAASVSKVSTSASTTVDQPAAASVSKVSTSASTTVDQSAAASVSKVSTSASTTVDQSAAASVSKVSTSASTTVDQTAAASVSKVSTSASTTVDQSATVSVSEVTTSDNKTNNHSESKDGRLVSEETERKTGIAVLPRRNRFQAKPSVKVVSDPLEPASSFKPIISRNVEPPPSINQPVPGEENIPDLTSEDSKPNEIDSSSKKAKETKETTILPRRSRFQVQPKLNRKTPGAISVCSSKPNATTVAPDQTVTDDEFLSKKPSGDIDSKAESKKDPKIVVDECQDTNTKTEPNPIPTLSRRSRFQIQPKILASKTKDKPTDEKSVNEDDSKLSGAKNDKSEAPILPRRNRFLIQPKPSVKAVDQSSVSSSSIDVSSTSKSNQLINNEKPLESFNDVTSEDNNNGKSAKDSEIKDDSAKDTNPKLEKPAVQTLARRSRFQVRPKLGVSKETLKSPMKEKEKHSEKVFSKTASSSSSSVAAPNSSKEAKRSREDKQSVLARTPIKQNHSERESSETNSSVPKTPVKLNSKSSFFSSPLKDNIQIENIKQREYPVNVPKASGKSAKSLPLREKQKKPDVSVHPSDKPPDKAKMKMRDLIYWNPSSNPMKSPDAKKAKPIRLNEDSSSKAPDPPAANENEPMAVPQVKIGADGNIVLNEESLVINNSQPTAPITMEVVDETDIYSNYGSFRKYTPKSRWSLKETKKFFLALSTVGTDFSLMSNLFSSKTRRDLKNKFKREERNNRWLVDKAIRQQLHFDEKLFEESESEEELEEPPTKKSRQKKDSSSDSQKQKKKNVKPRKSKKNSNSLESSSSNAKKTKKSKKMSNKDWVISMEEKEAEEEEEEENREEEEEVIEEETVYEKTLVISDETLTRTDPEANNQALSSMASRMPEGNKFQDEEVVNILMQLGQGRLTSPAKLSSNMRSSNPASSRTIDSKAAMPISNSRAAVDASDARVARTAPDATNGESRDDCAAGAAGKAGGTDPVAAGGTLANNSSLARLFLQQMGLNSQLSSLQDEIVSITEAEISNNDQVQKIILVEVQPKDQKQTVVHMYLVSHTEDGQSSADGAKLTVSEAQPLALPPHMTSLSDEQLPIDVPINEANNNTIIVSEASASTSS